jgi:hypothetical protein
MACAKSAKGNSRGGAGARRGERGAARKERKKKKGVKLNAQC